VFTADEFKAIPVDCPEQIVGVFGVAVMVGEGVTVITREDDTTFPQKSVTNEYNVIAPEVGKVIVAFAPDPILGDPVELKLQL
jgi:hypothetical protein